jgi:hypothetical protein
MCKFFVYKMMMMMIVIMPTIMILTGNLVRVHYIYLTNSSCIICTKTKFSEVQCKNMNHSMPIF